MVKRWSTERSVKIDQDFLTKPEKNGPGLMQIFCNQKEVFNIALAFNHTHIHKSTSVAETI